MKFLYTLTFSALLFASSCKKDSALEITGSPLKPSLLGANVDTLVGVITQPMTLTRTTFLKGIVHLESTLTIQPGVTIKGIRGNRFVDSQGVPKDDYTGLLIVERGAKLIANGTPSNPIVWTSDSPPGFRAPGDWGGVIILGSAPVSTITSAATNILNEFKFSTISQQDSYRYTYGSYEDDRDEGLNYGDNSGSITYNRFEFGGGLNSYPPGNKPGNNYLAENRMSTLTFAGVGAGTVIHHVEVLNSENDGFAFFGGNVNASHLLSYNNNDDDFDFTEGYWGNLQFIIGYRARMGRYSESNLIEVDNNNEGNIFPRYSERSFERSTKFTRPFISNATLIGPENPEPFPEDYYTGMILVRRAGLIRLANSIVSSRSLRNSFSSTRTTDPFFFGDPKPPYLYDDIYADTKSAVIANLFEPNVSAQAIKFSQIDHEFHYDQDGNSNDPNLAISYNAPLEAEFIQHGNSFYDNFSLFKLDRFFKPLAYSPALKGAYDLSGYEFFVNTNGQRGAVLTTDVWTAGTWISVASN